MNAGLERRLACAWVAACTSFYFALTIPAAIRKAFWYDEIFTVLVASLPGITDIWRALLSGMDNHPPLDYVLRHIQMQVFGNSELSLRAPSIVFTYITFLCVFWYARSAYSLIAGVCASAYVLASYAASFVIEARGYAFIAMCGAVTLVIFRRLCAAPNDSRWPMLLGTTLGLSVWTHYYAVLLFVPFGLAGLELWRSHRRFPLRLTIGLTLGCALAGLVAPFALNAKEYAAHFWSDKSPTILEPWLDIGGLFWRVLPHVIGWTIPLFVFDRLSRGARRDHPKLRSAEWVALLAIAAGMFWEWLLAMSLTGVYVAKYAIFCVPALSILLGMLAAYLSSRSWTAAAAVVGLAVWLLVIQLPVALRWPGVSTARAAVERVEQTAGATQLPVVAPSPKVYMQLYYYGSPELRSRLILLNDDASAIRLTKMDTDERAMRNIARFVPMRVIPYEQFTREHDAFLLTYGKYDEKYWICARLREDAFHVTPERQFGPGIRYRITRDQ